ncbi:MAG: death-on-curing protein [Candidatus Marinimicrobia bacterium]|nr:death-on-curing protein [Candidatus Neomarinimicrobiota bacterium]
MNKQNKGKIIIYKSPDGTTYLDVKLVEESLWLNLNELSMLFQRDKSVISRHVRNIYKTSELSKKSTVAKFATV